ncbi:PERF protein, partial [Atractosteus spatula]|nr:PERF protein [Atractosteus spatula]
MASLTQRRLRPLSLALQVLALLDGHLACRTGWYTACQQAPFVPGYNLAGEGFDIVRMQRKGAYVIDVRTFLTPNETCTLCENRLQGGQVQKLPLSVLDWRFGSQCRQQLASAVHESYEAVVSSSTSSISNRWEAGLDLDKVGKVALGGTQSQLSHFAMSHARADRFVFSSDEFSCKSYRFRLTDQPPLSADFLRHLQGLPPQYNSSTKAAYQRLIDTYGTHYVRQVELGGWLRRTTAIRSCLATLNGHTASFASECLSAQLALQLGLLGASASSARCRAVLENHDSKMGFSSGFLAHLMEVQGGQQWLREALRSGGGRPSFTDWLRSLTDFPDVVSCAVHPLHELVREPRVREALKRAVRSHIQGHALQEGGAAAQACSGVPNLHSNCCPLEPGWGRLRVTVERASGLRGDPVGQTEGYVKVWFGSRFQQTHFIKESNDPVWNAAYDFGAGHTAQHLVFEVWDKDVQHDDKLGRCTLTPQQGSHSSSCSLDRGGVFYYSYTFTCDPYLTGLSCRTYKPTP